jgi:hypothetical protein
MVECFRCQVLIPAPTPGDHYRYMTAACAGNQYWVVVFCGKCGPAAGIPLVDVDNFREEISPMTATIQ